LKIKLSKATIAYGAAKFNPTAKNELSAPTTYLSKKCSQHNPVKFVDEYNTTKKCHCCGETLIPIKRQVEILKDGVEVKVVRQVRGLRWCDSTTCRKFLNRDLNAALNILAAYLGKNNRPLHLQRNPRNTVRLCEDTH
jgi:transposase